MPFIIIVQCGWFEADVHDGKFSDVGIVTNDSGYSDRSADADNVKEDSRMILFEIAQQRGDDQVEFLKSHSK